VVEGLTEEGFVKQVLYPYLFRRNIISTPRLVRLKSSGGSIVRGGIRNYEQPKMDIQQWLRLDTSAYCTTMFDLYALPKDFPGMDTISPTSSPHHRVQYLENSFSTDLGNPRRFIPYLQLHEFEAILFSDINILNEIMGAFMSVSQLDELHQITQKFENPELIDDDPVTAPSKRLLNLYPAYDKRFFGELVAESIGIHQIRSVCPHFNRWIERLEKLEAIQ